MGLFQKAYETYESHRALVGVLSEAYREPLVPVAHIVTRAQISISINADGKFVSAEAVGKDEPKIIIPATEKSAGRAGKKPVPHPLCDQIDYVTPMNKEKHDLYLAQLTDWSESEFSHPMLKPILAYVKSETLLSDLAKSGITNVGEKDLVRWTVLGLDAENGGASWSCKSLFEAFQKYYLSIKSKEAPVLCMLTGETGAPAIQHLKGVVSYNGNAKLISANDKSNFTYRGRFTEPEQAETFGYEASQKAHNALKWLVANQGAPVGGRVFLCWNPEGKKVIRPSSPIAGSDKPKTPLMSDYRKALREALLVYRTEFEPSQGVVLAAFDAATSGRLALTYYSELLANDFFDRLEAWDTTCCFVMGDDIYAPSLEQIVRCAFGVERNGLIETDDKVMREHLERLIACRVNGMPLPSYFVGALQNKVSNPLAYKSKYRAVLFTACAVIRKYYSDHYGEEIQMALDKDRRDMSYQYGRLLAVLEVAERGTFSKDDQRDTNAERLQAAFCRHPDSTAKIIIEQLKRGYYRKIDRDAMTMKHRSSAFYEALIGEIEDKLDALNTDEQGKYKGMRNTPLGETYIIGYYHQKTDLYTKTNKEKTEE